MAIRAIASVSARVRTMPVGLCGLLSSSSLVLPVIMLSSLARSGRKLGRRSVSGTRTRAGHRDVGDVGVVVRLERDHLVARLEQGEQRGGDGLGRARGDQHLGVRVVAEAVEPLLVARHGRRSSGMPVGGRVLVALPARTASAAASAIDRRAVDVGEPLAEVDRVGGDGAGRHHAEDGVAEAVEAAVEQRSGHAP